MIWMPKMEKAVRDLRYLLNQGYPRESAVNFVSNHHRLQLNERHLLARCVFSKQEVAAHRRKSIRTWAVKGKRLGIDGYNVLITIESMLMGKLVVICDDGYVRDLRAIFGKYHVGPATSSAISAIIKATAKAGPREAVIFFDEQVSHSGELAACIRKRLKRAKLDGDSLAVAGVDMRLRDFDVVASSDRAVIERAKGVWNLPTELLKRRKAKILNLKKFR